MSFIRRLFRRRRPVPAEMLDRAVDVRPQKIRVPHNVLRRIRMHRAARNVSYEVCGVCGEPFEHERTRLRDGRWNVNQIVKYHRRCRAGRHNKSNLTAQ